MYTEHGCKELELGSPLIGLFLAPLRPHIAYKCKYKFTLNVIRMLAHAELSDNLLVSLSVSNQNQNTKTFH